MADQTQTGLLDPALEKYVQQALGNQQPVVPDQTPVEQSLPSRIGQFLGGGGPGAEAFSPAQREAAGRKALRDFGMSMMAASGNLEGGTIFTALGRGMQGAQHGYLGSEKEAAGLLGARQAQQEKQQDIRLKALKEAIPLLTAEQDRRRLEESRRIALGGGGVGGGGGGIGAAGADTYEGAIIGSEGTAPNPRSTAAGTGQFLASTWGDFARANPDLFKGMSPDQVLAARNDREIGTKAVTWLAQQNARTLQDRGVTPSGQSLGISHYLGAGAAAQVMNAPDNAPVSRFVSEAAVKANPELGTMTAGQLRQRYANVPNPGFLKPADGGKTTAAAATPPDAKTPPAGSTAPKPEFSKGGQPPPVPPEPPAGMLPSPEAAPAAPGATASRYPPGSYQVADVSGTTPPPTGSAADAAKAQARATNTPVAVAGVDGLWAMPNGLVTGQRPAGLPGTVLPAAPEAGAQQPPAQQPPQTQPPVQQPPAQQPPETKPGRVPDTFVPQRVDLPADIQQRLDHPVPPDQAERLRQAIVSAKDEGQLNAATKAQADAIQHGRTEAQNEARSYREKAVEHQREVWKQLRTEQQANDKAAADRQQAIDLKTQEGKQATDLEYVKNRLGTGKGIVEELGKTSIANRGKLDDLNLLQILSDNVADDSFAQRLSTMRWGDTTVANKLAAWGLAPESFRTEVGKVQQLNTLINGTILELRKGVSMGTLSDRDLDFIKGLGPNLWENKETRGAVIGYLKELYVRQSGFNRQVALNWDDGRGMSINEAIAKAQEKEDKHPILPMPDRDKWTDPTQRAWRQSWIAEHNIKPGSLMRDPVTQDMIIYGRDPKAVQQPALPQQPRGPQPATN